MKLNNRDIKTEGINCFEALSKIRELIFPIEPMIIGTQKYIFPVQGGWLNFYPHMELGKRYERKNKLLIFHPTKEKNFNPPKLQKAFMDLYQYSFVSDAFEEEYCLKGNIIVLEKEQTFKYESNKALNKNYQYFWIFDKDTNKVYDIKSQKDIELFRANNLLPSWHSLDNFIEWYCCVVLPKCPVPPSQTIL